MHFTFQQHEVYQVLYHYQTSSNHPVNVAKKVTVCHRGLHTFSTKYNRLPFRLRKTINMQLLSCDPFLLKLLHRETNDFISYSNS